MISLIEKHKFEQQSGLVVLLRKYNQKGPILDSFFEGGESEIALHYGDEDVHTTSIILSFLHSKNTLGKTYDINHPVREYLQKWSPKEFPKKIKWSKILEHNIPFLQYDGYVIVRDFESPVTDLRLALHSLERHIPVISGDFCPKYYDGLCGDDYYLSYHKLRNHQIETEDQFIRNLSTIVGRYVKHKSPNR